MLKSFRRVFQYDYFSDIYEVIRHSIAWQKWIDFQFEVSRIIVKEGSNLLLQIITQWSHGTILNYMRLPI